MDRILTIFQSAGTEDLVDILAVSMIFYIVFAMLRRSRSFVALQGLVAVVAGGVFIWIISRVLDLSATRHLLENSLLLIVIVFVLLFQNELKKALTDFGQKSSIFRPFLQSSRYGIDEVVKSVVRMSERKVGVLIAIERRNTLRPYIEVGTPIDAEISSELLRTIFQLGTPLHDGAVIISGGRVAAAGCLFPLSENPRLPKDLGTRHRAGIGLTEETDAVTIICSEETGIISICHDGKITRNEDMDSMKSRLRSLLEYQEEAANA